MAKVAIYYCLYSKLLECSKINLYSKLGDFFSY
jgi:hypothetical protein